MVSQWFTDADFMRHLDAIPAVPKSERHFKKWLEDESENAFRLAIRENKKDQLVGYVEMDGILWNHQNAWLGIGMVRPKTGIKAMAKRPWNSP